MWTFINSYCSTVLILFFLIYRVTQPYVGIFNVFGSIQKMYHYRNAYNDHLETQCVKIFNYRLQDCRFFFYRVRSTDIIRWFNNCAQGKESLLVRKVDSQEVGKMITLLPLIYNVWRTRNSCHSHKVLAQVIQRTKSHRRYAAITFCETSCATNAMLPKRV